MNPVFDDIFDSTYKKELGNLDGVITALKSAGATQMESAMILIKKMNLSLREADSIILNSIAWKDNKENTKEFRDNFNDFVASLDSE